MPQTLTLQPIVSRDEWLIARKALLAQEEAAAAIQKQLNEERRKLPFVEITKDYRFEGPTGTVSLLDLFEGRHQLIIYHFMFDPAWDQGCPYCSSIADNISHIEQLRARDTSLILVSRAPLTKILPFKERMGWTIPWYSSFGSDFNQDFYATVTESTDPADYMFKDKASLDASGAYYPSSGEQGGTSVFYRDGDRIFHTYSTFGPGSEFLDGTFNYLDLTPLGRQDDSPIMYHDQYPN